MLRYSEDIKFISIHDSKSEHEILRKEQNQVCFFTYRTEKYNNKTSKKMYKLSCHYAYKHTHVKISQNTTQLDQGLLMQIFVFTNNPDLE